MELEEDNQFWYLLFVIIIFGGLPANFYIPKVHLLQNNYKRQSVWRQSIVLC